MMTDEGAATSNGSFVANFKKVTAPSPGQLVIELKKPQATMAALDVPIVPKHVWEKVDDFSKFNNDKEFPVVGNGPFILTDYKVDSYVEAQAQQGLLARRAQVRRAGLQVLQGRGRGRRRPAQRRGLVRRRQPH